MYLISPGKTGLGKKNYKSSLVHRCCRVLSPLVTNQSYRVSYRILVLRESFKFQLLKLHNLNLGLNNAFCVPSHPELRLSKALAKR